MTKLTRNVITCAALAGAMTLTACGGGGSGGTLDGTYYPQFGPDANRLDRALSDQSWTFSNDGTVSTVSESGTRQWTYSIKGNKIHLKGASDRNSGESRVFTKGDNGCIWAASGNLAGALSFCP